MINYIAFFVFLLFMCCVVYMLGCLLKTQRETNIVLRGLGLPEITKEQKPTIMERIKTVALNKRDNKKKQKIKLYREAINSGRIGNKTLSILGEEKRLQ